MVLATTSAPGTGVGEGVGVGLFTVCLEMYAEKPDKVRQNIVGSVVKLWSSGRVKPKAPFSLLPP